VRYGQKLIIETLFTRGRGNRAALKAGGSKSGGLMESWGGIESPVTTPETGGMARAP
jgi:hypothetical protein